MTTEREKFLLFRIYRHKDQQAFGELYLKYASVLKRYLLFKLPTPQDVDDVLSEVFVSAWNYCLQYPVERFAGLIFKIARNQCGNYYKKRKLTEPIEAGEDVSDIEGGEKLNQLTSELSVEAIERSIRKLKEEYRDVLIMRYLEEMTIPDISLAMEKTENNVRVLIHRALKSIRSILDEKKF